MPAIWSSSERPISVRTVWVDGIRHAILSPDDPLVNSEIRRRPRTSKDKSCSTKFHELDSELDRLNNCFTDLRVVVEKSFPENRRSLPILRRLSAPATTKRSSSVHDRLLHNTDNMLKIDGNFQKYYRTKRDVINLFGSDNLDERETLASPHSSRLGSLKCTPLEPLPDPNLNPLSERVLQWLDLSGRSRDYDLRNETEETHGSEEELKWKLTRRRASAFKHENCIEKSRLTIQNYKLENEEKVEDVDREGDMKTGRERIAKMNIVADGKVQRPVDVLKPLESCVSDDANENLSLNDENSKDETESLEESATWSPPGRVRLHIIMPNVNCREKNMSSQESLICD